MLSLSQATSEALARTAVFEEELRKNNDIADRYEEQVNINSITKLPAQFSKFTFVLIIDVPHLIFHDYRFEQFKRKCNH